MSLKKTLSLVLFVVVFLLAMVFSCAKNDKYETSPKVKNDKNIVRLDDVQELKDEAIKKYHRFNIFHKKKVAMEKTVVWLKEQPIVKSAGITEDNETIWAKLSNGLEIDIIVK